jgi:hypothetical protein
MSRGVWTCQSAKLLKKSPRPICAMSPHNRQSQPCVKDTLTSTRICSLDSGRWRSWASTFRHFQRFVTELSGSASGKSVLNLLGTLNAVLAYAKKCGICVPDVPTSSLTLSGDRDGEVCRQNAVNASFGLLVLCVWVSLKWRGPTGIVYSSLNCGNHKLKAMISCGVGLLGTVGTASR